MQTSKHILVALDDARSAMHSLDYVAKLAAGRDDLKIHLLHSLEPLPPQLLESPGSEDPLQEEKIEQRQARQQDKWLEDRAAKRAAPLFATAKSRLVAGNVPEHNIKTHLIQLDQRQDLVPELIKAAYQYQCHTIVVGYTDYSWIKEQFQSHIGEQLIARAENLAVCVVK